VILRLSLHSTIMAGTDGDDRPSEGGRVAMPDVDAQRTLAAL